MGAAEIEGIIIGVIILARVIVYLTPTKSDDEYIGKVLPKALKIMYIVFGIDLSKGRKKYDKH